MTRIVAHLIVSPWIELASVASVDIAAPSVLIPVFLLPATIVLLTSTIAKTFPTACAPRHPQSFRVRAPPVGRRL
jgi:hypothetical protein